MKSSIDIDEDHVEIKSHRLVYYWYLFLVFVSLLSFLLILSDVRTSQSAFRSSLKRLSSHLRRFFVSDTLIVLVLNDIHYDKLYVPTGTPQDNCHEPADRPNFTFGQYSCDAPQILFTSLLSYAQTQIQPDFIVINGDFAPHGDVSRNEIFTITEEVFGMIRSTFPQVPIYATMGNHDFCPNWGTIETDPYDFASLAKIQTSLSSSELATFRKGGYFYHDFGNLRLLFLNSVMYSSSRAHVQGPDPFDQFQWIESVSMDGLSSGKIIGTTMHIPSGVQKVNEAPGWYPEYARQYHNLTMKYKFQFALNAHSHLDQFLPTELASSPRYFLSSPAVAPYSKTNPGFRVYQIKSNGLTNYQQYYADILTNPQEKLDWKLAYDFQKAYRANDLTPKNLEQVVLWVRDDIEGRWQYRARLHNQAMQNGAFYYCALTCNTREEITECQKNLASQS